MTYSLQLYTVRTPLEADLPGTIARVAELGFTKVEPYNFVSTADELAKAFAENGITAPSGHAPLLSADQDEIFAAANKLGTGHSATLVEAARHSFAHAVGLAMVVGSVVTLVNAVLVWSLQRRNLVTEPADDDLTIALDELVVGELVQASIGDPVRSTPQSERQSLGTRPPRNEPESRSTRSTDRVAS